MNILNFFRRRQDGRASDVVGQPPIPISSEALKQATMKGHAHIPAGAYSHLSPPIDFDALKRSIAEERGEDRGGEAKAITDPPFEFHAGIPSKSQCDLDLLKSVSNSMTVPAAEAPLGIPFVAEAYFIEQAIQCLRDARDLLRDAGAVKTLARVETAIEGARGARRHAVQRAKRAKGGDA